jgi:hypothetical protein
MIKRNSFKQQLPVKIGRFAKPGDSYKAPEYLSAKLFFCAIEQ